MDEGIAKPRENTTPGRGPETMKTLIALFCCSFAAGAFAQATKPVNTTPAPQATPAKPTQAKSQPSTQSSAQARQPKAAARTDRLELDTTVVTGNRELPKVLYIVPWKKAEIGDLPAQPFNTLLDEVLTPVDREVFKREVKYFETVTHSNAAALPEAAAVKEGADASR
jgi:hypothetical protein